MLAPVRRTIAIHFVADHSAGKPLVGPSGWSANNQAPFCSNTKILCWAVISLDSMRLTADDTPHAVVWSAF